MAAVLADRRRIALHRRVAQIGLERIDIRPSRRAVVAPLSGVLAGAASFATIAVFRDTLPVPILGLLLVVAVVLLPLSGMGMVYSLFGTNIIFDRRKESATFQQGFLGLGLGTVELVPFHKIVEFVVEEAGEDDADPITPEEFTQWQVTLVKTSGRRLRVGGTIVLRSMEMTALAPVVELGRALAALTGKPLAVPDVDEVVRND